MDSALMWCRVLSSMYIKDHMVMQHRCSWSRENSVAHQVSRFKFLLRHKATSSTGSHFHSETFRRISSHGSGCTGCRREMSWSFQRARTTPEEKVGDMFSTSITGSGEGGSFHSRIRGAKICCKYLQLFYLRTPVHVFVSMAHTGELRIDSTHT